MWYYKKTHIARIRIAKNKSCKDSLFIISKKTSSMNTIMQFAYLGTKSQISFAQVLPSAWNGPRAVRVRQGDEKAKIREWNLWGVWRMSSLSGLPRLTSVPASILTASKRFYLHNMFLLEIFDWLSYIFADPARTIGKESWGEFLQFFLHNFA